MFLCSKLPRYSRCALSSLATPPMLSINALLRRQSFGMYRLYQLGKMAEVSGVSPLSGLGCVPSNTPRLYALDHPSSL